MSYAIAWCYQNMTTEQFEDMIVIDRKNYLEVCPFVKAFKEGLEGPLVVAASAYRRSPAWFALPSGGHTGEVHQRSPLRRVLSVKRINTGDMVVGEFKAR